MGCGRLFLSTTTHSQYTSISTPYHSPRKSIAIAVQNECYYNAKAMLLQPKSTAFSCNKRISNKILGVAKENDTIEIDNKQTLFALFQHHKNNRIIILNKRI